MTALQVEQISQEGRPQLWFEAHFRECPDTSTHWEASDHIRGWVVCLRFVVVMLLFSALYNGVLRFQLLQRTNIALSSPPEQVFRVMTVLSSSIKLPS